jgi:DNA repair protein RadC
MAHNHPSGKLDISPQDIQATNEMFDAVTAAGIRLVDHIIVAGDDAVSLTDMGHISQNHDKPGLSKTATAEKTGGYSVKPLSIKEQLAIAEKQLAIENAGRKPQTRNHGREAR